MRIRILARDGGLASFLINSADLPKFQDKYPGLEVIGEKHQKIYKEKFIGG